MADMVKNILPEGLKCVFGRQKEKLGLGHAALCAKRVVGNEPFALLLADLLTYRGKGITSDHISGYKKLVSLSFVL
jgi:UTP--glucose-1-phosphate uridylyltransferase